MHSAVVSRRSVAILAGAAALLPEFVWAQGAAPYLVATLANDKFPLAKVGDCAALEQSAKLFDDEAKRATQDLASAGAAFHKRATAEQAKLKQAIKDAKNDDIAASFKAVGAGVRVVVVGLGCYFATPVAIGLAAGALVLEGPVVFAVQATFREGDPEPAHVWGYAKDRAIMLRKIAVAGSDGAKLFTSATLAVALATGAYHFIKVKEDKAKAKQALQLATARLAEVDAGLTKLGTDAKKWGLLYAAEMAASRDGLRKYIEDMKATNCMFVPPAGPVLKLP